MAIVAGFAGTILLLLVLQDAFEVMLLPRRVRRRVRFVGLYYRSAWSAWRWMVARLSPGLARDDLLSHFGPLSMLALFVLWAAALIVGFGLLQWAVQPSPAPGAALAPLTELLYLSGATFSTVGYGDVAPHSGAGRLLSVLESSTGLGFIAVVIGYLPVLYQLFSRREVLVIQLDGRAGSPPTATTLLCRHAGQDASACLDALLREWEVWASELLESHLSYPMLAYYRSQHDNQSWLAAIAVAMDVCALILVGAGEQPVLQARMTFGIARQVIVEMARSFRLEPSRFAGGDRLSAQAEEQMAAALTEAGVPWDRDDDTFATLLALRATYEPLLSGLAQHLLLPLPGWVGDAKATDHWAHGHRGLLARALVQQLAEPDAPVSAALTGGVGGLRRLLSHLRR